MADKLKCRYCGRLFNLKTKDGLYARSLDLSALDRAGLFCRLRCAAAYGIRAATQAGEGGSDG